MKDQVNIPVIVTLSVISGFMVLILVVGVQAWYLWEVRREIESKWANSHYEPMTTIMETQKTAMNGYKWVDKDKGLVAVPVTTGMQMLIASGGKMPSTQPVK